MTYNDDNIFAKILNKKLSTDIILENEHAIAFHDIAPQAPVHILIIPKGKFIKYDDFLNKASNSVSELTVFNPLTDTFTFLGIPNN